MREIIQKQVEREVGHDNCPVCSSRKIKLVKEDNTGKIYSCSCGCEWRILK